jgi:hypothetical protein
MRRLHFWWAVALIVVGPWAQASTDPVFDATPRGAARGAADLARRVLESADHRGLPFAIVDKQAATIALYRGDGTLAGASSALLGQTRGDGSAPGVGERTQSGRLNPGDRTTSAGRFTSEPGRNLAGEPIVWIDYANALAIHRLRPGPSQQQRRQRLASTHAQDKRISAGCVVVPEAFYDAVVQPVLGHGRGVVYVMPEEGLSAPTPG